MHIFLWILQVLLGIIFTGAGAMKASKSKADIGQMPNMEWTEDFSETQIKTIGVLEVLGGLGLILPMLTGIAPILTPIAAIGLVLTMVGAAVVHFRRGENQGIIVNVVLLLLAAFIAYGRLALVA